MDFDEFMESGSFNWSLENLTNSPLKQIQHDLRKYLIENGSLIKNEISFGNGYGRYQMIRCVPLLDVLMKYEEYSSDLGKMIVACMGGDLNPVPDLESRLEDAIKIDTNFRSTLFPEPTKMTVKESMQVFDAMMALECFIDNSLDNFRRLLSKGGKDAANEIKALSDLHANSITSFVGQFATVLKAYIESLKNVMENKNAHKIESPKPSGFVLM